MREIKFRGMGIFDERWAYGGISNLIPATPAIITKNYKEGETPSAHLVNQETVGQYTGLKDKNDVEIYEGDIVRYKSREQVGTRGNYKNSYAVYGEVDVTGVVKFGNIEDHYDYKHVLTFFVDSTDSVSYDSFFFSDSRNRRPQNVKRNLTKPLLIGKEYEVIGNIYEHPELIKEGVN